MGIVECFGRYQQPLPSSPALWPGIRPSIGPRKRFAPTSLPDKAAITSSKSPDQHGDQRTIDLALIEAALGLRAAGPRRGWNEIGSLQEAAHSRGQFLWVARRHDAAVDAGVHSVAAAGSVGRLLPAAPWPELPARQPACLRHMTGRRTREHAPTPREHPQADRGTRRRPQTPRSRWPSLRHPAATDPQAKTARSAPAILSPAPPRNSRARRVAHRASRSSGTRALARAGAGARRQMPTRRRPSPARRFATTRPAAAGGPCRPAGRRDYGRSRHQRRTRLAATAVRPDPPASPAPPVIR